MRLNRPLFDSDGSHVARQGDEEVYVESTETTLRRRWFPPILRIVRLSRISRMKPLKGVLRSKQGLHPPTRSQRVERDAYGRTSSHMRLSKTHDWRSPEEIPRNS